MAVSAVAVSWHAAGMLVGTGVSVGAGVFVATGITVGAGVSVGDAAAVLVGGTGVGAAGVAVFVVQATRAKIIRLKANHLYFMANLRPGRASCACLAFLIFDQATGLHPQPIDGTAYVNRPILLVSLA